MKILDFDPISELFIAQGTRPKSFGELNLRTLSPFQRALLVIDGTVTKFIEAFTMEPIKIVRLSQKSMQLSEDNEWLEARSGALVLIRQVLLQGRYSDTLHAFATSIVVPDRLDESIRQHLDLDGEGLGRMLISGRMETRREVLWYGKERAQDLPEIVRNLVDGEFISRTYRIIAKGTPIMLINEKFPYGVDALPSHY